MSKMPALFCAITPITAWPCPRPIISFHYSIWQGWRAPKTECSSPWFGATPWVRSR